MPCSSVATLALGGCTVTGAPSFTLFDALFPAWMFCALIGIATGIATRIAFVASGLATILPYQLFVHAAIGRCAALFVWLLWFGR